jgi:hypothetical protein
MIDHSEPEKRLEEIESEARSKATSDFDYFCRFASGQEKVYRDCAAQLASAKAGLIVATEQLVARTNELAACQTKTMVEGKQ